MWATSSSLVVLVAVALLLEGVQETVGVRLRGSCEKEDCAATSAKEIENAITELESSSPSSAGSDEKSEDAASSSDAGADESTDADEVSSAGSEKSEEASSSDGNEKSDEPDVDGQTKEAEVKPHNFSKKPPKYIAILAGPPGAGKGTVAEYLKGQDPSTVHVCTGDLLRAKLTRGGEEAEKIREIMNAGDLVPDEIPFMLNKEKLENDADGQAFLLDGYARRPGQVTMLLDFLKEKGWLNRLKVINIKLGEEAAVKRLSGRKYHKASGRTYGPDATVDEPTGESLEVREDDNADTIRARMKTYEAMREALEKAFADGGVTVDVVEGDQSPLDVAKGVSALLTAD